MDKVKFQKLQKLTKDISILYIEDNRSLQNQVGGFFKKIFGGFFQAFDAQEGFEKFKKLKPDLVLCDLSLPKKSGFEMIVDMKELDPDIKIITLSSKNDDEELLRSIDFGIIDFLNKPLDLDKLNSALLKALEGNNRFLDDGSFKELKSLCDKKQNIRLLNYFKGIPMVHGGKIDKIIGDEILLKIPFVHSVAVRYEKQTLIEIPGSNKHIQANMLKYDKKTSTVTFIKPKFIKYSSRDLNHKRLVPDKSFQGMLHHKNKKSEIKVLDISSVSLSGYVEDNGFILNENDELEIGLVFELENKDAFYNSARTSKGFCHAKLLRKERFNEGFKLVFSIKIKKSDESTFNKYLHQREMNIIQEFKKIVKNNQ